MNKHVERMLLLILGTGGGAKLGALHGGVREHDLDVALSAFKAAEQADPMGAELLLYSCGGNDRERQSKMIGMLAARLTDEDPSLRFIPLDKHPMFHLSAIITLAVTDVGNPARCPACKGRGTNVEAVTGVQLVCYVCMGTGRAGISDIKVLEKSIDQYGGRFCRGIKPKTKANSSERWLTYLDAKKCLIDARSKALGAFEAALREE